MIRDNRTPVYVIWPDIYDLAVSKLAIARPKDIDFIRGLEHLGLIDKQRLADNVLRAPRTSQAEIERALAIVDDVFESESDTTS